MNYKKDDYNKLMNLYSRQDWLPKKESSLENLLSICDTIEQKDLLFSLLGRFSYLKEDIVNLYLQEMANYIIDSGFIESRTQLVACTYGSEADSGQKILDMIKTTLYEKGWRNITTTNVIGKAIKEIAKGKDQIIIIDEFIGTGKTLKNQIDWLSNNTSVSIDIKCCFMAGMKNAVDKLMEDSIELFCPLQLEKGISEFFKGNDLLLARDNMHYLESKLAQEINEKKIAEYSFGYGHAEALYSLKNGNTPNSVFPIFWWIKDINNDIRNTVLTRYEKGFE